MKKITPLVLLLTVLLLSSCHYNQKKPMLQQSNPETSISFDPEQVTIDFDSTSGFILERSVQHIADGVDELRLKFSSEKPAVLPKTELKWHIPSVDIDAYWTSKITVDRVTYWSQVDSRASSQAPVICLKNNTDKNRFSLAVSDALNYVKSGFYLKEEDARFHFYVVLFDEPQPKTTEFELSLRFDRRMLPYEKSLNDISEWYASMPQYEPAKVPDVAYKAVYSTWYNFHQNLIVPEILKELKLAKSIGLETIIVDDGWQTMDNKRGYAWTGDWKPERIPEMKAFVDRVHQIGMKCMLWYSLPFIGKDAEIYPDFKGKYLTYWESQGTWVLDPRYPEVREHIIHTYEKALADWDLDGFKLDFLGWFSARKDTKLTRENGRDYASVNEATDRLMTDIMQRLKAAKPDIMIEFRQPYIGPVMRKYGNMFRAADCPGMAIANRNRTLSLRLLAGNTAVHSDMFLWNREEPAEKAALQILNVLFSVPQLSVKLDSLSDEQMLMTRFWMQWWNENSDVLLKGELTAIKPEALFPVVLAENDEKSILAVYDDFVANMERADYKEIDFVNAKSTSEILVDFTAFRGDVTMEVYSCTGELVYQGRKEINQCLLKLDVPPSGLVKMKTLFNE